MSRRLACVVALLVSGSSVGLIDGCGSDSAAPGPGGPTSDAPSGKETSGNDDDSGGPDPLTDAGQDSAKTDAEAGPNTGETCIGFGKGTPCGAGAFPDYGYVCFKGGPPGFTGCKQASATGFGDTWCCPENKCVAQPDQDSKECKSAGTPHRYQCPPDGDGGSVAPPPSCIKGAGGGSAVETFYCCP